MCLVGHRIMIVEDTASVGLLLAATLRRSGCAVDVVPSVSRAIEQYEQAEKSANPVAALLVDLNLGGRSGDHLIPLLSGYKKQPHIIMMSADGTSENRQKCLAAGAAAFFEKPFDINILLAELARLLDLRVSPHRSALQTNFEKEKERLGQNFHKYLETLAKELTAPLTMEKLQSLLHQTKGSASLYGYEGLAVSAKRLSIHLTKEGGSSVATIKKQFRSALMHQLNN